MSFPRIICLDFIEFSHHIFLIWRPYCWRLGEGRLWRWKSPQNLVPKKAEIWFCVFVVWLEAKPREPKSTINLLCDFMCFRVVYAHVFVVMCVYVLLCAYADNAARLFETSMTFLVINAYSYNAHVFIICLVRLLVHFKTITSS